MQWLILSLFLDVSYFPANYIYMYQYNNNQINYENTYCAEFGFKLEAFDKWVFIEGFNYCSFNYAGDANRLFNFCPNIQNYKFGIGVQIHDFLKIGYEHSCMHPVIPYLPIHDLNKLKQTFETAYDRIYVRFETKFTLKG